MVLKNITNVHEERQKAETWIRRRWKAMSDEDVSDFGAYCAVEWLKGRDTCFKRLASEYGRQFMFRTKERGSADLMAQPTRAVIDMTFIGENSMAFKRFEQSHLLRDSRLSTAQRTILILYYEWQFTLKEIGDVFGVGEARASYILSEAEAEQKKRVLGDT